MSTDNLDDERPADPDADLRPADEREAFIDDERRDGLPDQDPADVPPLEESDSPEDL